MLQDFLSNRPATQSSSATETEPHNSAFQPFFAGRVAGLGAKRAHVESDSTESHREAVNVEIVRESGEVRQIIVTCACGEKMTIDCEY